MLVGCRFSEETAFSHHQHQQENQAAAASREDQESAHAAAIAVSEGAGSSSGFLLPQAAWNDLVAAGRALHSHAAAGAASSDPEADDSGSARNLSRALRQRQATADDSSQPRRARGPATLTPGASPSSAVHVSAGTVSAELLQLPSEVQQTDNPAGSKAAEGQALPRSSSSVSGGVGELELVDEYLGGLEGTSRLLQQALQQHSSVMKLVGFLDTAHGQHQLHGQADSSSAAAHTAAWVAATSGYRDGKDEVVEGATTWAAASVEMCEREVGTCMDMYD